MHLFGGARRRPLIAAALVVVAGALLMLPLMSGLAAQAVPGLAALVIGVALIRKRAFGWTAQLGFLFAVILFIPIRRYVLPGNLPFQLEPYRVLIAVLVAIWGGSMLVDPRIRFRRTGLEGPVILFSAAVLASIALNLKHITPGPVNSNVLKALSFQLSFFLLTYLITSVVRREHEVYRLLEVLVVGGAVISVLAVIESRTRYNVFDHLHSVLPFLRWNGGLVGVESFGRFRALGPAEHPIALSAAFAMLVPIAGQLAFTRRRRRWWLIAGLLVTGCLATVSRTGVVMLVAEALTLWKLRPLQMRKLAPALVPLLIAVHVVLPGTLGTLKQAFFPAGGLVQQQMGTYDNGRFGAGRLGPTFAQINAEPIFGIGFGTRITGTHNPDANAMVLDDQWLVTLLETGIVGVAAWIWLLVRLVRRLSAEARIDQTDRGGLLAALTASVVAFGVSMLTYDTFSFVQVTIFFYVLVALASVVAPAPEAQRVAERHSMRSLPASAAGALGAGLALLALALVLFVFFQGASISFMILVLVILTLGLVGLDRSLDPAWRPRSRVGVR